MDGGGDGTGWRGGCGGGRGCLGSAPPPGPPAKPAMSRDEPLLNCQRWASPLLLAPHGSVQFVNSGGRRLALHHTGNPARHPKWTAPQGTRAAVLLGMSECALMLGTGRCQCHCARERGNGRVGLLHHDRHRPPCRTATPCLAGLVCPLGVLLVLWWVDSRPGACSMTGARQKEGHISSQPGRRP